MLTQRELAKLAIGVGIPLFTLIVLMTTCSKSDSPKTVSPAIIKQDPLPQPPREIVKIAKRSPEAERARTQVLKIDSKEFCLAFGKSARSAKKSPTEFSIAMLERATEIEGITRNMVAAIEDKRPAIGMNACAVLAALGRPDRAHRSTFKTGQEHYQLVYSNREIYVYLEDGIVSSIQD